MIVTLALGNSKAIISWNENYNQIDNHWNYFQYLGNDNHLSSNWNNT